MKYQILFLTSFLAACSEEDKSCDDYVSYMCDCHQEENCDELTTLYSDPTTEEQNDCAVALDEQQVQDDDAGLVCGTEEDTSGEGS